MSPAQECPPSYADRRILVTGGAGAIGSRLVRSLLRTECSEITVLDDLSSSYAWNLPRHPRLQFIRGSVYRTEDLERAFKCRPTHVFHLAALFANQRSIDQPVEDLQTNGLGTLLVLQQSSLSEVERVVFASSGCSIYGSSQDFPLRESSHSLYLKTPYQITKMLGELYSNYFLDRYSVPVVKLRLFNSYGPGEVPGRYRNVIPNFVYWALNEQPLPITGSGEETRDFTYVEDVVDAMLRSGVIEHAVGEEINIASGAEVSIARLAELVNTATGNQKGTTLVSPRPWDNKARLLASIDRAKLLLGYSPRTDIETGVANTVAWFRKNWSKIERSTDLNTASGQVSQAPRRRR